MKKPPARQATWLQKKRKVWKAQGLCQRCGEKCAVKTLRSGVKKKMSRCQPCLDYQVQFTTKPKPTTKKG